MEGTNGDRIPFYMKILSSVKGLRGEGVKARCKDRCGFKAGDLVVALHAVRIRVKVGVRIKVGVRVRVRVRVRVGVRVGVSVSVTETGELNP